MAPQLFTVQDGKMEVFPHPFQEAVMDCQSRYVFALKGMQAGWTSFLPHLAFFEMQRCGPGNPALVYLGIAPTLQVARNKLIPEFVRFFCDLLGAGKHIKGPKECIEITEQGDVLLWGEVQPERTTIFFCHASEPDSFAGYTAIAAFGDEIGQKLFKRGAWMELTARLAQQSDVVAPRNPEGWEGVKMGRFFGGSTVYALNWLYDFYTEWEKYETRGEVHPSMNFIRFDSTENPSFPRQQWEDAKATLPDWMFDMRYRALFRRPAGMVYDCWNPPTMLIDATPEFGPDNLPAHFTIHVGVDFGQRNFRCTFWAKDPRTNRYWLIGVYEDSEKSNKDRAKAILEYAEERGWTIASGVGGQISEQYQRDEMAAGGLILQPPAYKPLKAGITNFYAAIKLGKVKAFRDVCPEFEEEMKLYSWPIDEDTGKVLEGDPEDKETFHVLDTARYLFTVEFNAFEEGISSAVGAAKKSETAPPINPEAESIAGIPICVIGRGGVESMAVVRARRFGIDDENYGRHIDI